ncbi:putative flavin-containing monooxygenase 1 [Hibiscus syriacus]|uniref:Flavin-containing monooxygenase n=1 Tax=Hibiscus syriacus TaxID=106335 RepID=A0A6A3B0F8_HIBSY|nr:probable flavin-containing monooxygenase 1 [Hibiscus syriacus]KAE8710450.1 putative flavin-containing monooxygenase 1 [Hibiscus syriacus]
MAHHCESTSLVISNSKIAIIGAGFSGIAAAKQLCHHNPIVFEASDSIGGVWKSCAYNSTKLQSTRKNYEFAEFPWPNRDDPTLPSKLDVLDYLESYAKHFDVLKFIKFNSKVVELRFFGCSETTELFGNAGYYWNRPLLGQPVWEIAVQTNDSNCLKWYAFEFVVVCIGQYGDIPKIPKFLNNKGPEIFEGKGKVLHTIDYCKLNKDAASQLLKGKKVVVVGYKKSAIDLVVECAQANQGDEGQPCTMVVRTPHWVAPHHWLFGLLFFIFYTTRSSELLRKRPNQTVFRTLLCYLLSPVRRGVSKFMESFLLWKLPLNKYGLKPDHRFEEDIASCMLATVPEDFFAEANKGNIVFKRAAEWWFWKEGIEFTDKTKMKADVVILATGYDGMKKLKTILPEPFCSMIEYPYGMMALYRHTIHPLIPKMAFVGYIESVSNVGASELRSIWLARLIDEKFKLPSAENMVEKTLREMEFMRKTIRFYQRPCISTFEINETDQICEEMRWLSKASRQDYSQKN